MRHNYTVRKSALPEFYDTIYDFIPERPDVNRIINHPRKLVIINRSADPLNARSVEIYNPDIDMRRMKGGWR